MNRKSQRTSARKRRFLLKAEDIEIQVGRAQGGKDFMRVLHKPTGIHRVEGPPLPNPVKAKFEMLGEIEAELLRNGLTQHLVPLNVCPVCSASVGNARPVGGIWNGSVRCRAQHGPMYAAICQACGRELIACPTEEEATAGTFCWEVEENDEGT